MSVTGLTIEQIARVCHEANRAYQQVLGEEPSPPWDDAPPWARESMIRGVEAVATGRATSPRAQHEAWLADKLTDGWVYGPEKNAVTKTHPCLVEYARLPIEQRRKDYLSRAIMAALTRPLNNDTPQA